LYNALKVYKTQNDDKDFAFMHCFKKFEGCKKWNEVRLTLNEADDIEGLTPPMVASAGHKRPRNWEAIQIYWGRQHWECRCGRPLPIGRGPMSALPIGPYRRPCRRLFGERQWSCS
jgi:hypothetical protein